MDWQHEKNPGIETINFFPKYQTWLKQSENFSFSHLIIKTSKSVLQPFFGKNQTLRKNYSKLSKICFCGVQLKRSLVVCIPLKHSPRCFGDDENLLYRSKPERKRIKTRQDKHFHPTFSRWKASNKNLLAWTLH